jgi:hypothetical protein
VPEYGIRSVLPLSSIVPVPLSENAHAGMPVMLAVPEIDSGTDVPFTDPDALPAMFRPPPHCAVNVPLIALEVCDVI